MTLVKIITITTAISSAVLGIVIASINVASYVVALKSDIAVLNSNLISVDKKIDSNFVSLDSKIGAVDDKVDGVAHEVVELRGLHLQATVKIAAQAKVISAMTTAMAIRDGEGLAPVPTMLKGDPLPPLPPIPKLPMKPRFFDVNKDFLCINNKKYFDID